MPIKVGPDRLPALPEQSLSPAQRRAAQAVIDGPRGGLRGPFIPLLRSPALLERCQRLGEYLRFHCVLPAPLREFAIVITARHWRQGYEWHVHAPLAERAGVSASILQAVAQDQAPQGLTLEQQAVYEVCTQLHRQHAVSDASYARALELFGEQGVVELTGLCGYYALLGMVLNLARTAFPGADLVPFDPPS